MGWEPVRGRRVGAALAVLRGYTGTDLEAVTPSVATVTCPFTGERLTVVAALVVEAE